MVKTHVIQTCLLDSESNEALGPPPHLTYNAPSSFNLATKPVTSSTLTPASRLGGSSTRTVFNRAAISTPISSALSTVIGFFLAFMILGRLAYLGSLRRRSVVITIGRGALTVSTPPSTSLTTVTCPSPASPPTSTLAACVAWLQP